MATTSLDPRLNRVYAVQLITALILFLRINPRFFSPLREIIAKYKLLLDLGSENALRAAWEKFNKLCQTLVSRCQISAPVVGQRAIATGSIFLGGWRRRVEGWVGSC